MVISKKINEKVAWFDLEEQRIERHNEGTIEYIDFAVHCSKPDPLYSQSPPDVIENILRELVVGELSKKYPEYNVIVAGDFEETITADKIEYSSRANFSRK